MSKNKRMIYVWDENIEFYDELSSDNKASSFVNEALAKGRKQRPKNDPLDYVRQRIKLMDEENARRLAKNQKPEEE
jgi:hypothetical protein